MKDMDKYKVRPGILIVLNEKLPPNTIHASQDVYDAWLRMLDKDPSIGLKVGLK